MPGRGNYWQKGGLPDDTVQSADIEAGTIQESDLDSALQSKVNSGGGNVEVILDATVPSNLVSHTLNFTRTVAMDGSDVGLVKIIISDISLQSPADIVEIGFNGDSSGMTSRGVSSNGTSVTPVLQNPITDGITFTINGGTIIIEIPGDLFSAGGTTGCFAKFCDNAHYSNFNFDLQSSAFDPLVSITIKSRGGVVTINTPTRIVAYAFNKD